jgi:hypothetical protein
VRQIESNSPDTGHRGINRVTGTDIVATREIATQCLPGVSTRKDIRGDERSKAQ